MQFKDVIGQDKLKERLIISVKEERISHAQLFLGKFGNGSLALALAYLQYINCNNRQEKDSCGTCRSCLKMEKLAHPDLHFAYPVNTNNEVKSAPLSDSFINDWRELCLESPYFDTNTWHQKIDIENKQALINVAESKEIIRKLTLKSYEANYKIMLIWKAELMNNQAASKLLKTIEEPTDKTIIILLAEEEEKLLKTIVSRTQVIRVPPINESKLHSFLSQNDYCPLEKATHLVSLSRGNFIECMRLLNQDQERTFFLQLFKKWMRACYEASPIKIADWVNEVSLKEMGREKQKRFLDLVLEIIQEIIRRNYLGHDFAHFKETNDPFLQNFSPFIHENNLRPIADLLSEAHNDIGRNANGKIVFMDTSLKMANLLRVKKRTFVN